VPPTSIDFLASLPSKLEWSLGGKASKTELNFVFTLGEADAGSSASSLERSMISGFCFGGSTLGGSTLGSCLLSTLPTTEVRSCLTSLLVLNYNSCFGSTLISCFGSVLTSALGPVTSTGSATFKEGKIESNLFAGGASCFDL